MAQLDAGTEPMPMPITAIAPWFGGKRALAPAIIAELGPHDVYWDPCCGSLAVLLAKLRVPFETVNDLHGDVINLARVLAIESEALSLYTRLARTLMHETLHREAAERYAARGHSPAGDVPDADRAYDYVLCAWMGRNGVAGTSSYNQGFCVRYTRNGGHAATRWVSMIESIPAWHQRLRHVTILNRDLFEILGRIEDRAGTAIYVDPPYLVKGAKYINDFAAEDHVRLAECLRRFQRTRVVVSYYEHPLLDDLYPGYLRRRIVVNRALAHQSARKRGTSDSKAIEVLLVNGPLHGQGADKASMFDGT